MNETISPNNLKAPAHVPPELVYELQFDTVPGVEKDSVQAIVDALRGRPEIFYALGGAPFQGPGCWVVTRHELVREAYQNAQTFSSIGVVNFAGLAGESWPLLPLEVDPPEHTKWRMLLNPLFSPARMAALEGEIDELAINLVEGLKPKGGCDFVKDFAAVFPVQIFLRMFGLPLEDTARFLGWSDRLIHGTTLEERQNAARAIVAHLRQVIAERRRAPTSDLLSYVVTAQIEGRPLNDDETIGVCMLLYSAGLDTVTSMLGFIFKHLAEHPADQQRLRDDLDMIPSALEELLRAYPIVASTRLISRDIDFHGVKMKKGDLIKLPTMAAGRDDREFPQPDVVDLGRENVSHITFAAGPHRCMGSHLARRELRIALVEWLKRIPPFRVTPGETPITHGIGVFGLERLPLSW